MSRPTSAIRRFLRWLFGSPIEELPPEFGDPRPPELQAFKKELEVREELQKQRGAEPSPKKERQGPGDG